MNPSYEFSTVQREGQLLVVTINRPERLNALHPPTNVELAEIFDRFSADRDLLVAILTGAGDKAFSAGHDLRWHAEGNKLHTRHGHDSHRSDRRGKRRLGVGLCQ
jgi:crotonobetainyl-CoA hydratase